MYEVTVDTLPSMRDMNSYEAAIRSTEEVLQSLQVDVACGLSPGEVTRRRDAYGRNKIETEEEDPLWKKYLEQFKEPLIILLLVSAAVSLLVGQYDDAISITLAIVIVVSVAFWQEMKSEEALKELDKMFPTYCKCLRASQQSIIPAEDLVPGDIVYLSMGDVCPADIRLVTAMGLSSDQSLLTGEREPCNKSADSQRPEDAKSIPTRNNCVFMGTNIQHGHGVGVVVGTAENTELGIVYSMVETIDNPKTRLQKNMEELGTKLSFLSFAIIGVILLIGVVQGRKLVNMFTIAVSLAVAAIPEGLPIVVTVTLALGVLRMAKKNVIVKKLPAVEALGAATVLCCDKTGTLTENNMRPERIVDFASMATYSVVRSDDREPFFTLGERNKGPAASKCTAGTVPTSMQHILSSICLCNNATLNSLRDGRQDDCLGDGDEPSTKTRGKVNVGLETELALLEAAHLFEFADPRPKHKRINEKPFTSVTKYMSVTCQSSAHGHAAALTHYKGAFHKLARIASFVYTSSGELTPLTPEIFEKLEQSAEECARLGLRTLAIAHGQSESTIVLLGLVALSDPPRQGVKESIATLKRSGVSVCMITGDMRATAETIAEDLGLYDPQRHTSMSGHEVEGMSLHELAQHIEHARVFYRVTPKHKVKIVEAFQADGHVVGMTGDGVNDAPALKLAEIGVSMGSSGSDVAKAAADVILVDDNFSTILNAIKEGKGISFNVRNFLRFQLSTSLAALLLITICTMLGVENPLNAMQILWINILMDGPPAQSLGVEPVDPDVMRIPPRKEKAPIITMNLVKNVVIAGLIIVTGTLYVYHCERAVDGIVTKRDTTMTFTTFVLFDMFNALSCRSATKSVFEVGFTTNPAFLVAVGFSLLGQLAVIYLPPLQAIFQTETLNLSDLAWLVLLTSSVWLVDEARKYVRRRRGLTGEALLLQEDGSSPLIGSNSSDILLAEATSMSPTSSTTTGSSNLASVKSA